MENRAPEVTIAPEGKPAPPVINIMAALKESTQAKGRMKVREAVRKRSGKSPKDEASSASPRSRPAARRGDARAKAESARFVHRPELTPEKVAEIRSLRKSGTTVPDIIRRTQLSKASIYRALNRQLVETRLGQGQASHAMIKCALLGAATSQGREGAASWHLNSKLQNRFHMGERGSTNLKHAPMPRSGSRVGASAGRVLGQHLPTSHAGGRPTTRHLGFLPSCAVQAPISRVSMIKSKWPHFRIDQWGICDAYHRLFSGLAASFALAGLE